MKESKINVKTNKNYLAIDVGASSGRHIVESNGKYYEVFRFETGFTSQNGHLICDIERLYNNVLEGIRRAFEQFEQLTSLAIDTWGVDYVLMQGEKAILPCYAYRDDRTLTVIDSVHHLVSFDELYTRTGTQSQPFNTIYQLYADKISGKLEGATDFLMLPEYLNFRLTNNKVKEYTNATTTGLVNAKSKQFDCEIIDKLGLPRSLFPPISQPKAFVGALKDEVASFVGGQTKVVLCASHDTASAVAGIPIENNQPYLSSGTWSLLGVKTDSALTDKTSKEANFSNEGGVNYNRYQKNIMGMWVVNELLKELCPNTTIAEIVALAVTSDYCQTVDVNDNVFFSPKSMKKAFDEYITKQNKPKPQELGDYFSCAYLSLAQSYANTLVELQNNTGRAFSALYIVGGGAKNDYLNQLTQKNCKIKVIALPIEATAIGNLKMQKELQDE